MERHYEELKLTNLGTRASVRRQVVETFLAEEPGLGNGEDASRYIYYVETLSTGKRVFLSRPAPLNKGFDFIIRVEDVNFSPPGERCRSAPKHEDLIEDLTQKMNDDPMQYAVLYSLLKRVFDCQAVSDAEIASLHFSSGCPVDLVVKVMKWMFVEQDIAYWNKSGRNMLWSGVPEPSWGFHRG